MNRFTSLFVVLLLSRILAPNLTAEVYQVTQTGDSGPGSFRQALEAANMHVGRDSIVFRLDKDDPNYHRRDGYWTILLSAPLPLVTDGSVVIDGTIPGESSTRPQVLLSGLNLPAGSSGLIILSANNLVKNICFAGFRGPGVWIKGSDAQNNLLENCYFGTLPDGMTGVFDPAKPAFALPQSRGILLSQGCRGNVIRANLICNMFLEAVYIEAAHGNVLTNNLIGVTSDGVTPLGNGWLDIPRYDIENQKIKRYANIRLATGALGNVIGPGNVICAGGRAGVHIESPGTDSTRVIGNLIGVGADGEGHPNLGNGEAGLKVQRGPRWTQIGGLNPGEGNVISGNYSSGMQIRENVSYTVILGNLIGLNARATSVVANSHNGIYFFGQKEYGYPLYNIVGPANIILTNGSEKENESYAGTWAAVRFDSAGTAFNRIFGNYLGTDPSERFSGANTGVIIGSGAHDNQVGPDNVIARNKKYGVWIRQAKSVNNRITRNRFFGNGRKPIFLEEGGNTMLTPPMIIHQIGMVSGTAVPRAEVELYLEATGEFFGQVKADAYGRFTWQGPLPNGLITALQIDDVGNTSEFSQSITVPVELSSFTAERTPYGVLLRWRTESESNNLGFAVERGPAPFVTIGFVHGAGTCSEAHQYEFMDATPPCGRVSYRLRQEDADGFFTYSQEIALDIAAPDRLELSPAFPNPFNQETLFFVTLPEETDIDLRIVDMLGRTATVVMTGPLTAGVHRFRWEGAESFASGRYFIRLTASGTVRVQKILLLR